MSRHAPIDFDIAAREFLAPLGEPGTVRSSLKEVNWYPKPIGWDEEEGEPIYGPPNPEDEEKFKWWRSYRLVAIKHTKPEAERQSLGDGAVLKAFQSAEFDSRDEEASWKALWEVLGMAVTASLDLRPETPTPTQP